MTEKTGSLWRDGKVLGAVGLAIVAWLGFGFVYSITKRQFDWPGEDAETLFLYLALAVSAVPLLLVLLDFVSRRGLR